MKFSFTEHQLHLKHTFRVAGAKAPDVVTIGIVQIETDGTTGYGEASPSNYWGETIELIRQAASRIDLGKHTNPLVYELILNEIKENSQCPNSLLAAVDMALFDCVGKKMGIPLQRFFGFQNSKPKQTSFTIGFDDLDVIQQKVKQAEPYPILKLKLGTSYDIEIVENVRSITDKPIRIDANEGWLKEEAVEKITWLQTQNVECIEQPLPAKKYEETAWVKERVTLPLIADESIKDIHSLQKVANAFDGINIKLMKCGGILEAIRLVMAAKEKGLQIMLGCMVESSLGIAAAAQLIPLVDYVDLDSHLLISNDPFQGLHVNNGHIVVEKHPGLGVWLKENIAL